MSRIPAGIRALVAIWVLALVGLFLSGCGDKIAIPQAVGDFSTSGYQPGTSFDFPGIVQLTTSQGRLYVLSADSLSRRNTKFEQQLGAGGFENAQALCVDGDGTWVFVWEEGAKRVQWFDANDLAPLGAADLPEVATVVAMVTNPAGIEQVPGAVTYLYLSDPVTGVIHRFAFDVFNGLIPHGILTRSGGQAARFVLDAAGMATDSDDFLLVCDADTSRNWVIRFSSEPDVADVGVGEEPDPLRGQVALFDNPSCVPPPASDYVIGDAAGCEDPDWVGGPSTELGEFHRPVAVAVDGSGRIFVADRENDRIQVFSAQGEYLLQFGSLTLSPAPISLGLYDTPSTGGQDLPNYAGYVFVAVPDLGVVRRFESNEQYKEDTGKPPPPPQ
jgi:hypothetical protein